MNELSIQASRRGIGKREYSATGRWWGCEEAKRNSSRFYSSSFMRGEAEMPVRETAMRHCLS